MIITKEKMLEWLDIPGTTPQGITIEILLCLNNTIDEAAEKICESIDSFINAKLTSDKVIQGVLKDIRAAIDDNTEREISRNTTI